MVSWQMTKAAQVLPGGFIGSSGMVIGRNGAEVFDVPFTVSFTIRSAFEAAGYVYSHVLQVRDIELVLR